MRFILWLLMSIIILVLLVIQLIVNRQTSKSGRNAIVTLKYKDE